MQNFNAPKKGNKGAVKTFLILAGIFLIAAIVARYFDQDEVKTGSNSSEEAVFASAK